MRSNKELEERGAETQRRNNKLHKLYNEFIIVQSLTLCKLRVA